MADASIAGGVQLLDGKKIPRIGFGTFQIPADEAEGAVLAALEAGYRHIDCARLYGNERAVGRALASCGIPRDEVFVTSKVWNDRQMAGPDEVRRSVEETLDALGLDRLDLLLVHWPVRDRYRGTWEQFQGFKQEGLATSIGVSNFWREHLDDLLSDGSEVPVVDQIECSPYWQPADALAACTERGIVVEAWSPLGGGTCTSDAAIEAIADAHGIDAGQAIIAWLASKGIVMLPRSTKPTRIAGNLAGLDVELTREEIAAIDALECGKSLNPNVDPIHFNEVLNTIPSPHD